MIKLLGLDLDDTLIYQDREFLFKAFERTCKQFKINGFDINQLFEEYRQLPREIILGKLLENTNFTKEDFINCYREKFGGFEKLLINTFIFPEVKDVLEDFRKRGIGVFLVTYANRPYTDTMLNRFSLKSFFDCGIYTKDKRFTKSNFLYRVLVKKLLLPSSAAYVGDMAFDVTESKKARVLDVLLKRPGAIVLEEEGLNPSMTISSLEELIPRFTEKGLL